MLSREPSEWKFMSMPNLSYLWLAAQLKLRLTSPTPPRASYADVTFAVEPEHYQLRGMLKQQAVQPVLAQLLSLCDADTLFVDIGANVGIFSLLVAAQTSAQVLAIEPVRTTFHALVRNCSLNPSLPVAPLNLALGAEPGFVEITAVPGSGVNQVVSVAERQGEPRQPAIQLSLDQLCLQDLAARFKKIVVKIDVERYEFEVLRGANHLLSLNRPVALCVEVEVCERQRLREVIGDVYESVAPPFFGGLSVFSGDDPSNVFFVNSAWRAQGLPC